MTHMEVEIAYATRSKGHSAYNIQKPEFWWQGTGYCRGYMSDIGMSVNQWVQKGRSL